MEENRIIKIIAAVLLSAGIVGAGFFIGNGIYSMKMNDKYVTVKGLAEKDVTADLAVWSLKLSGTGDNLTDVYAGIETQKQELIAFLKGEGITDEEISEGQTAVTDLMAQEWRSERAAQSRFIVNYAVAVRTNDVQKINTVSGHMGGLIKKGVVISDNSGPQYIFTKLNEIKPAMLAEATKTARSAAEQFAADSGSRVGKIRRAYQGVFSIQARDGAASESTDGYMPDTQTQTIDKKVRVVSTVDYYLAD